MKYPLLHLVFKPALPVLLLTPALLHLAAAEPIGWPQWRGPARDAHLPAGSPLPATLPRELQPLWKQAVGPGHSSPVVVGDILVYLDEQDKKEIVHAVTASTGVELWRRPFAASYLDEWGSGPRATPFIDGDRVYAQSCRGDFVCLRLPDGERLWGTSFEEDFGVKFLGGSASRGTATRRGNNGCGVIDGNRLILPVGSTEGASLVAFDKLTGAVLWKCGDDEAAYSSLVIATLAGVRQVVAFTADALLGADVTDGRILWRVPLRTAAKRHAATPVVFGDRIAVNSHSIGLVCVEIVRNGDVLEAREAWANKNLKINIATPVHVDGHLYCQGPNRDFVCVEAATGTVRWSQPGFGLGRKDYSSALAAGDKLLVLSETGTLFLLAADAAGYRELGRLQVCGNTWSFPAYAGGKLFVRDPGSLFCLDLAGGMAVDALEAAE